MGKTIEASRPATASQSSAPFFDKKGNTTETAPSFFAHSGGIQTKLAIGKADDAFEQEADQVADQVQAKLSVGAPDDPYEAEADQMADKVVNQMKSGSSIQTKKQPSQRGRECEEGDYVFLKPAAVQRLGEDIDSNGSRESIVAAARSMIGKIEAKHAKGGQRVGANYLLDIFHLAAPGVWDDSTIQTAGAKLPSWCGIFSVWAHKKAGKDIGTWQIGKGVSAFGTIKQTSSPQAGDIGYIDQPFQHHCIIVKVDGNTVHSIDGNSGLYSEVKENTRPLSTYTGFFTAFGAGGSVQKKPKVQRKGKGEASSAPSSVEQTLSSTRGKGDPLPDKMQQSMGAAMGADFSEVRIHNDHAAADMSNALDAQAFTHGKDIYFNQGKYNPSSKDGQHLLAHELTHTVQQGASAQRKLDKKTINAIQKNGNTGTASEEINEAELNSYEPADKKGSIKKSGNTFTIKTINLPIKGYADESLIKGNTPFKRPTDERNTKQGEVWRSKILDSIKKSLEASLSDPSVKNEKLLVLELKKNPTIKVVGSFNEIAEEIKVPFWNKAGDPVIHQIEHRIDYQLIGSKPEVVDDIRNILLLDRKTNNQYGQNIKKGIQEHIQSIIDHYQKKFKNLPNAKKAMADKNYEIVFDTFLYDDIMPRSVIIKQFLDLPNGPFNPITKANIDVRKFEVKKGYFILKTNPDRAGYLLPYNAAGVELGAFRVTTKGDEDNHKLTELKLQPASSKKRGKTILEKDLTAINFDPASEVQKPVQDVYVISNQALAAKLKDLILISGLSPVSIKNADIDSGFNLQVHGIVNHDVQFLKDNNIEVGFDISGPEVSVYASISKDNIKVFPKPFEITYSSLTLIAGTEGVVVDGDLGFEIKNLGKGNLGAIAGTTGFAVSGDFEFESKKFKGSSLQFKYAKNKWEIKGHLVVPEPKLITGIEKADLTVSYNEDKITAKGNADLDIPGFSKASLDAEFNNNGSFSVKGGAELKKMPGIKGGGKVEVTVSKPENSDDYKLSLSGELEPDLKIPNLNSKLAVSYNDGLFKAEATVDFSAKGGMLSGQLKAGVTNGTVVEGVLQKGEGGKDISVYGNAKLKFKPLAKVEVDITVKVNPKGEALFSATLDVTATPFEKFEPKPLQIVNISKSIPAFGVPFLTLNVVFGLDASLYASLNPLTIEIKGAITDKTYDDLINGKFDADLGIKAKTEGKVGLQVGVKVGASGTLGVLEGGGTIGGNIKLEANGELTGKVDAKWGGDKGLKINKITADATIGLNLIPGLDGRLFVDLDLLVKKVNLWEKKYKLLEGDPISLYQLGVTAPLEFDENNKPLPFDFKKVTFTPPLDKKTAEDQGNKAIKPEGSQPGAEVKEDTAEEKIKKEVAAIMRNQRKNSSNDMYTYSSNLRQHMLKSTKPELTNIVIKAVEDELRSIELEDFTAFRAEVLSSKDPTSVKLTKIDAFEKEHLTVNREDLNQLRNDVKSQNASGAVQQKPLPGDAHKKSKPVQKKELPGEHGYAVPDDFAERMQQAKPHGLPLPLDVRAEMGKEFGADFSQVRVHYDNEAIALTSEVNAQAFTNENHIFFNRGKYEPGSTEGKKLLVHELTHVLQQGHGEPVKRVAEKDATGTKYTGNYIFNPGHDGLNSGFFNMVKKFVGDGSLSDTEIRTLRKNAIDRNGSVLHAELLLMAAMRNPVNVALMQAHRGGSLILSMSNILQTDKEYVINFDRSTIPPEIANPVMRLALAFLGLSGEDVAQARAAMDTAAEEYIRKAAGKQFSDQADKLIVFASFTNPVIPLYEIVEAMVNASADSTPGDQIMAGSVYLIARKFNHSTAGQILNGTIKIDALIPSVYRRLQDTGDATYSYSTDEDVSKANTLYIPTNTDILTVRDRALIIHELTHAEDDLGRSTEQDVDSLDLESRAYEAQGRHLMEEIILGAPAPGFVTSASGYVNLDPMYYWSMLLAAKKDLTRYQTIFLNLCTSAPASKTRASVTTDLALAEVTIKAKIRAALLAHRNAAGQQLYTTGTTTLGGGSGHYFQ